MARRDRGSIIIKLMGRNIESVNSVVEKLKEIAKRSGIKFKGPIMLPTRRMKIRVRRSPCGQGRETYDIYEMRVHKRLIIMGVNERVVHQLMRLEIPKDIEIEMKIKE